jgi:hypothetical protein
MPTIGPVPRPLLDDFWTGGFDEPELAAGLVGLAGVPVPGDLGVPLGVDVRLSSPLGVVPACVGVEDGGVVEVEDGLTDGVPAAVFCAT